MNNSTEKGGKTSKLNISMKNKQKKLTEKAKHEFKERSKSHNNEEKNKAKTTLIKNVENTESLPFFDEKLRVMWRTFILNYQVAMRHIEEITKDDSELGRYVWIDFLPNQEMSEETLNQIVLDSKEEGINLLQNCKI